MVVICILILLLLGAAAGWQACKRWGYKVIIDQNNFYRNYITDLKTTLDYWKDQSAYNKEVENTTIKNHNTNLKETLNNILYVLQKEEKENLNTGERENIETIIKTIKSGISSS